MVQNFILGEQTQFVYIRNVRSEYALAGKKPGSQEATAGTLQYNLSLKSDLQQFFLNFILKQLKLYFKNAFMH